MSVAPRAGPGSVAALPLAAAFTLLLAGALPVEFAYRPNALGIVSLATQQRYPVQQETFWAFASGALAGLLAWGLSRALAGAGASPRVRIGVEALAAAALASALFLPSPVSVVACVVAAGGAFALGRGAASSEPGEDEAARRPRSRGSVVVGVAGAVALGFLLAPGVWANLWSVARGVPDEWLVVDNFKFLAEAGQHLAWANALAGGALHGRDLFCLYGPLYDWSLVGFWGVAGRSVAGWELYWSLTRVLGWIAVLLLGAALLRHPLWALLIPFTLPWVKLRVGLGLFGLLFLTLFLRGGRAAWAVLAGATGGLALLYSQEFGLAFLMAAGLGLALRRDARGAGLFAAGLAATAAPVLGYYAVNGALAPMLRDLVAYPSYLMAGYGKLPFPSLLASLPLGAPSSGNLAVRLGYAVPAVCVAAALLALPISRLDPRRPLASLRELASGLARDPDRLAVLLVAVFGIVAFRSALGRSQLSRTLAVAAPAAILLVYAFDRLFHVARREPGRRWVCAWQAFALAGFVLVAGFVEAGTPWRSLRTSVESVATLRKSGHYPRGSPRVTRVARWIEQRTEPGEPVLFLPNDAAYYYLTDRPSPIRFVLGHQMVTNAHRAEALAALRAAPPRYVVWNHGALRVDELSDELVFGRAFLDWIEASYEAETRIGEVEILRRRDAGPPRPT